MRLLMLVFILSVGSLPAPCQTTSLNGEPADTALSRHRRRIDVLDKQIVSVLNERARIALEIGRLREREKISPSSAQDRQKEVLRNVMANSVAPLSPAAARRIYEIIIAEMVAIQAPGRTDPGAMKK